MRFAVLSLLTLLLGLHPAFCQEAVAVYEVLFSATWSAETHPSARPPDPHFSPPIAASHDASIAFWLPGGIATQGIEDMSELGATSPLTLEMEAAISRGATRHWVASDGGMPSPGAQSLFLELSQTHPLATFVSMVAPSPDWFVGVTGVPLFEDGAWVDEVSYPLYAWDAGSDLGSDFVSPDIDQQPQGPIDLVAAPFSGTPALGSVTFRRFMSVVPCFDGIDQDDDGFIDYPADPGCTSPEDLAETEPSLSCDDGLDNDGDQLIDSGTDPGCRYPTSATESPQCQDGIDNDGATGIDFDGAASLHGGVAIAVRDPQCTAAWMSLEAAPPRPIGCGIGPELVAGLGVLLAARNVRTAKR